MDEKADKSEYPVRIAKRRNGPVLQEWIVTTFNPARQAFGGYEDRIAPGVSQPLASKPSSEPQDSVEDANPF
jgi:hypothetical protein